MFARGPALPRCARLCHDAPVPLTIRPALAEDCEAFARIYRPIVLHTSISYEEEPPDAAELAKRLAAVTLRHPWLAAEEGGEIFGYAYATTFRARVGYRFVCESSVYVADAARGRGVGVALYRVLLDVLRRQGFATVYAGISLPNDASIRLHERVGFRPVGVFHRAGWKLGRFHDAGFWELSLRDGEPNGEVRPWREVWEPSGGLEGAGEPSAG